MIRRSRIIENVSARDRQDCGWNYGSLLPFEGGQSNEVWSSFAASCGAGVGVKGGLRRPVPQPSEARNQALRGCGISGKDSCVTEALSGFPDIRKFDKIQ